MRAFSSLIGHILGSHPDINGYYEMHISYQENKNLLEQLNVYTQHETLKLGSQFLFDKLLHNEYELELKHLELSQPKILITLRSPEQTIKSIVNLFQQKEVQGRYADPAEATAYYIDRVQKLAKFCLKNSRTYYYFDAELIQIDTQNLLKRLTHWLQLSTPLDQQYQLFSKTGKARAGDSSSSIKSGMVIKRANDYSSVQVSGNLLKNTEIAYKKFRSIMLEHAIDSTTG